MTKVFSGKKGPTAFRILAAVLVACLSFFVLMPASTSEERHAPLVEYLDSKKAEVMEMTALSTVASVAISAIPDDTASPIATQLAELSDYFLIILCAIYLERFLVSIIGFASFGVILPAACAFYIFFTLTKNQTFKSFAVKSALLAAALYLIIPSSVSLAGTIEKRNSETIQEVVASTHLTLDDIKEESADENDSAIKKFFTGISDDITAGITYAKEILNHFVDAIAILLITSCAIPILIAVLFFILTKMILRIEIQPKSVKLVEKPKAIPAHEK